MIQKKRVEKKQEKEAELLLENNKKEQRGDGCGVIEADDPYFPVLLKQIENVPKRLYYRGTLSALKERCFAVVGTRKPTEYGRWAAYKLGKRLSESGFTVVSGMAAGIDTLAHKGALSAGGRTIAVLGCGIDICFPAANKLLMEEIEEKGLLLSEYPPGYPPSKFTFPKRNRIISGLCEGIVVVEAGLASGSLITAERAAEQGRSVYALPGNINSVMSIGANKLICDGAQPIAVIDDLLWDLGVRKNPDQKFYEMLSSNEKKIVALITEKGEVTSSFLCQTMKLPASKVNEILTVLEMKGIICTYFGKIFIAK